MIERLETDARLRDRMDNRPLLHQKRRHRLLGRYPQKVQVAEERAHLEQEAGFSAKIPWVNVRTCHVVFGTLTCVSTASLNQDAPMATNVGSDTWRLMCGPTKSQRTIVRKDHLPQEKE